MSGTRRRWASFTLAALSVCLTIRADDRPVAPRNNRPLANFTLMGVDGKPVSLYGFAGKPGAVLFFLGNDCPVATKYLPKMAELAKTYEPKGIVFLGINANASEDLGAVAAHARGHAIPFRVFKDSNNLVADLTSAGRTSEVIVLDNRATIRYRGAIDDQHVPGASKPSPTRNYLADALDAILARRPVEVASTTPVGCPIERVDRKPSARVRPAPPTMVEALRERDRNEGEVKVGPVTYAADVAAIVQTRCQACHRAGEVGPFPLMTYDDAREHAGGIAEVVESRRMPPWHADPRYSHFRNDRSLTAKERATLLAWVDQGSPLGDPAKLPPAKPFPQGWSIGKPDLVIEVPRPNAVPAFGVLDYVNVDVPSGFDRDTWIQAAEVRPDVRSVVHHVIVYVRTPNAPRRDPGEHLAAYVPGETPTMYPEGIAKKIPAGAKLHFQIHYTPDGTARTDRPKLGLVFAKSPVQHRAYTRFIQDTRFEIPPNDPNHEVKAGQVMKSDLHLYSLSPHMHLRGKDFRFTATYPDGRSEILLSVPAYDFGWQSGYIFTEPRAIPKGTRIDCLAHFDNSSKNSANPDPSQTVRWGEQSSSEMMMGYLDYVDDAPADWKP